MKQLIVLLFLFLLIHSNGTNRLTAQTATVPDWENPAMFNQNKEKPRTYFIPFRSVEEALNLKKKESV